MKAPLPFLVGSRYPLFIARALSIIATFAVVALPLEAKPKAPLWLQEAMERTSPVTVDAKAVVIEDYCRVTHKSAGRIEATTRFAVRILDREEEDRASLGIHIRDDAHRIRHFRAWMVYPSGRVEEFKSKDTIDVADDLGALRSDSKVKWLDRRSSVRPGCVFAYEYNESYYSIFVQQPWGFQGRVPSLYSRLELEIPAGWSASSVKLNDSGGIHEGVENGIYFWEARNQPAIKEERYQPPLREQALSIAVWAIPPEKEQARYGYLNFDDWNEVARYENLVIARVSQPTAAVTAKARALVAGTSSQWEQIQAICDFTQTINYLSVSIDISKGGGFEPRRADEVLKTHWGDCKDMSALTVSMLDAVGIPAYPVLARIGPDPFIFPDWAAPQAFNHCIVAIPVDESVVGSAVVEAPRLGQTVIFDPTNQDTPVGELPYSLFDGTVLIGHPSTSALLKLPVAQPSDRKTTRTIEASLSRVGTLQATIHHEAQGVGAAMLRRNFRLSSDEDREELVREWISGGAPRATIEDITFTDSEHRDRCTLEVTLRADGFARTMDGATLMVFRPVFVSAMGWVPPEEEARTTDYICDAWYSEERIQIALPDGFEVDSLPESRELANEFGKYSLRFLEENGVVIVERGFEKLSTTVPPERYSDLVDFYLQILRSDSSGIVLKAIL